MSLGFNLAGSLAAIDQWVHDMSSGDDDEDQQQDDDDDEDDSESENEGYSSRKSSQKNNYSSSNVKKSSLLTITANTFSSTNIHGNNSSNSHAQDNSLTTPRVLSREAIFSMVRRTCSVFILFLSLSNFLLCFCSVQIAQDRHLVMNSINNQEEETVVIPSPQRIRTKVMSASIYHHSTHQRELQRRRNHDHYQLLLRSQSRQVCQPPLLL
jgi:hypothetical protein